MASNNSEVRSNLIQVKKEPGSPGTSVSSASSTSTSVPLSERVTSIKMEPGVPTTATTTTTQRLTSFRLPRDLTLGGNVKTEKPKKVYTPNLNVQRKKKDDSSPNLVKAETVKVRNSDRGRERGRGERGRGRGDSGNIIQSVGVWSEGIYTAPASRKKSESSGRASSSTANAAKYLEKSKLNKITDKIEDEMRLKNLLRDDFIDDGPDVDDKMFPLMLPRVKKDIYDTIDNDEIDKKPIISENGEIMNIEEEKESKQERKEDLTISQIIENKANSYTLIQFPESLPGLESSREETGSKQSNNSNTRSESDNKAKSELCTLNSLQSGLLGKLEIFKSGKARLRLGEMSFFVDIGAQQRFQQDLLAVKIDATSQTGDLINLGQVNNKLICSPDFESTLENS